ncbi:hypothetical protein KC871_03670 [Candidatus Saccharibacteria bacterium]|nr:hypothetical protein [Candidatus Saccharibacteria bacterium]
MKISRIIQFIVLAVFVFSLGLNTAYAEDKPTTQDMINKGIYYYDPVVACIDPDEADEAQEVGSVLFVGDSILVGTQDAIKNKLIDQNIASDRIIFDGEVSRSINKKGQSDGESGIDALKKNKNIIKNANTVVVELGTNGGIQKDDVKKLIDTIKDINKKASIYWVNIGVTRDDLDKIEKDSNKVLDDTYKDQGFTIIDWAQEVTNANKQSITLLEDGVHTNEKGKNALAEIITNKIKDSATQPLSSFSLNTNYNTKTTTGRAAKIWAYLTSDEGLQLTPVQAAGALGNLEQENSLFHPKVTQGGGRSNEVIVDGSTGYGIMQWTSSGRQQGLKSHAEKIGKSSGTLDAQLSYIKHELNNGYESTLDRLKEVKDDPIEAAFVWHGAGNFNIPGLTPTPGFESSGDTESVVRTERGGSAKKWLNKFGDKNLQYSSDDTDCYQSIDNSDIGVEGSKIYTDSPMSIPKGKQVAEQAKRWAKNDPNCGFHGSNGCTRQCLGIVSDLWKSVGKGMVSGETAWDAYKRYRDNGWVNKNKEIPIGAIMWSAEKGNEGDGHAYTYIGNGLIASNDIEESGKYSIVSADEIEKKWGHTFYGWSEWHG